tara:strand:+ start:331 stop:699 length:369 start_codon:yes stop_codon:yes gene_type:complete
MKYFLAFFFVLSMNIFSKECNANDTVCVANLLADVSDSNDAALAGMVVVGFAGYYYFIDKSPEEKKELMDNFKNGMGLELINRNNFSIEIPSPTRKFSPNQNSFFARDSQTIDFLKIKYSFN